MPKVKSSPVSPMVLIQSHNKQLHKVAAILYGVSCTS